MMIKINPIYIAEELAHQAVKDELVKYGALTEAELLAKTEPIEVYTDEAQDCYNRWMDYYTEMITNRECEFDWAEARKGNHPIYEVNAETHTFILNHATVYHGFEMPIYELNGFFFHLTTKNGKDSNS